MRHLLFRLGWWRLMARWIDAQQAWDVLRRHQVAIPLGDYRTKIMGLPE